MKEEGTPLIRRKNQAASPRRGPAKHKDASDDLPSGVDHLSKQDNPLTPAYNMHPRNVTIASRDTQYNPDSK